MGVGFVLKLLDVFGHQYYMPLHIGVPTVPVCVLSQFPAVSSKFRE